MDSDFSHTDRSYFSAMFCKVETLHIIFSIALDTWLTEQIPKEDRIPSSRMWKRATVGDLSR